MTLNYLQKNLRLLQKRDPTLAEHIARLKDPDGLFVVNSQSGLPTLLTIDREGKPRFLHSPKNPAQEAGRLLEGYAFKDEDGTILFGFGLGYLVKEIVKRKAPNHVLYILEASTEMFKLAMTHMDLSDILSDNNIGFFIGNSLHGITDHFDAIQIKAITGKIHKLSIPHLRDIYSEQYEKIDKHIDKQITSLQLSYATFNATKELRLDNLFRNIPNLKDSFAVDNLEETLRDKPALVIAAGPSLTKEIPILKKCAENSFIISVDSALKPLFDNGIRPNLVATCESHPSKLEKVEGITEGMLRDIPLVYSTEANPEFVGRFNRKFIINIQDSLSSWFVNMNRRVPTFPIIQTVSKLGFFLARLMGANPIILVGLDLSFPLDREHAEGSPRTWKIDFENHDFVWVPDNSDGKVKTIEGFVSMIHSLEQEIRKTQARCINVSKYGALIRGTEWMPLEKALRLGNRHPVNIADISSQGILAEVPSPDPRHSKTRYLDAISWMLEQIDGLVEVCREAPVPDVPPESAGIHAPFHKDAIATLRKSYESAFAYRDFLDILTDYMPRYMTYCAGSSPANGPDPKRFLLFFQELNDFLPLLKAHCREALSTLQAQ